MVIKSSSLKRPLMRLYFQIWLATKFIKTTAIIVRERWNWIFEWSHSRQFLFLVFLVIYAHYARIEVHISILNDPDVFFEKNIFSTFSVVRTCLQSSKSRRKTLYKTKKDFKMRFTRKCVTIFKNGVVSGWEL